MDTRYWNDMNHYYMVLEEKKDSSYQMQMVLNNHIPGVLDAELRREDDRVFCYYEITGKETLSGFLEHGILNEEVLRKILTGLIQAVQAGQGYLLEENDFILEPEYVYWEAKKEEVALCYISGHQVPFHKQMEKLIEYLLNKVNYQEQGAVLLIYALYKKVHEVGCTFRELLDLIQEVRQVQDRGYEERKTMVPSEKKENQDKMEDQITRRPEKDDFRTNRTYRPLREKVEGEKEILRYPLKNYILAGITFFLSAGSFYILYRVNIFDNSFGTGVNLTKMAGTAFLFLLLFCFLCYRLFQKNQKIARIVPTTQYIDSDHLGATTVLCDFSGKEGMAEHSQRAMKYQLHPLDENHYEPILLEEFPFFIGKLKSKVDYTISNDTISRFHAKIDGKGDEYYLMDLNSTNGTYWNGEKLKTNEKKFLQKGDIISFANVRYEFCDYS